MALTDRYETKAIVEEDKERESARVPSGYPSGPQRAGSPLVAAFVEQLAFGVQVSDFATHVLAQTALGPVEIDVIVESCNDVETGPVRWAILVEDTPARTAIELASLRDWCRRERADLRVMKASEIDTTFLANVRLLKHTGSHPPDPMDQALRHLFELVDGPDSVQVTVADATEAVASAGFERDHVRLAIDRCVASGLIACDLKLPYGDQALLTPFGQGYADPLTNARDPALVAIMAADRG